MGQGNLGGTPTNIPAFSSPAISSRHLHPLPAGPRATTTAAAAADMLCSMLHGHRYRYPIRYDIHGLRCIPIAIAIPTDTAGRHRHPQIQHRMSEDAKNPDNMTPNEREQWLRDRGVHIETPSDRRRTESIFANMENSRPLSIVEQVQRLSIGTGSDGDGINFVFIPHDTSRDITTLTLPNRLVEALGPTGDVLPTYVKSYFADGKPIDGALLQDQALKQNLIGGDLDKFASAAAAETGEDSLATTKLTPSALASATASGSVETFPLVRPSSTNHNQGVYIYLDEVGQLKKLPNNLRASSLAQKCGYYPAPNFYGDVFVGRVSSKPVLHNIDIKREDILDTTKEWMVRATHENVEWQKALNEVTGRTGESQPNHAGTEGVAVHVQGNMCSYSWMQNDEEVEIIISLKKKVEDGMKVDKTSIKVDFQPRKVIVKCNNESILEVQLYSKLDVDGCTWTLDKESLVITCEKASQGEIWPRLELSG